MLDLARSLEEQRAGQRRETAHGPMAKTLTDLCRYKEIFRETQPRLLIETGTWTGASAHWFGWQMRRAGANLVGVVTIDTQTVPADVFAGTMGYDVCFLKGSSTDPDLLDVVRSIATAPIYDGRVMVVLDSDHAAAHVESELEHYAPFVGLGQYLVVEDTITRWCSPPGAGYDGSPADALDKWLALHSPDGASAAPPHFVVDQDLEDMLPTTQHPGGWLRRVS